MQCSVINYKTIKEISDFRYEPEFFLPKYLEEEKLLSRQNTVSLSDCATFSNGRAFDSNEFSFGGDIYISRIGDVTQKRDYKSWEKVSKKHFEELNAKYIRHNDILMTLTGDPPDVGKVQLIFNPPGEKLSWNQRVALLRIRKQKYIVSPEFLFIVLSSKYCRDHVERWAKGIRQRNVGNPAVLGMAIPVFSKIQNSLVEIVKTSFNLLEQSISLYNEAELILLSELGLLNWKPKHRLSFVKKFSDTQASERIDAEYFQPMYEEVVKAVKSSKNHASLGDIVLIKKCIEPGSDAYKDGGIPFLRVSNLSKFGINNDNQQFISETLYDSLKTYQPKKGEILLSKDATLGIAYYLKDAPHRMIPSGGILRITVKDPDRIFPEYLTLVFNSVIVQKQIERDAGGSIINHWLVDQVKNTLIPILSLSTQKKIAERVDHSFSDREQSKHLLDIAKRGVEMAIEKSEKDSQIWINSELKKINIH